METKKYKIEGKRGIDDLSSEYAFGAAAESIGSSNSLVEYQSSEGWLIPIFEDISSQEVIDKEVIRRKQANLDYIKLLKKEGRYGEEFEITIELVDNPLLDEPDVKLPLESARMVFIDFNDILNEPKG